MRTQATRLILTILVAVFATAACSARGQGGEDEPMEPATTLTVDNRSWSEMTVYVLRSGQRIRLGQVSASSTETFVIPSHLIFGGTSLRFLADPLGSNVTPVSHDITVVPGDNISLMIPNR